jgi:hypothetical protein
VFPIEEGGGYGYEGIIPHPYDYFQRGVIILNATLPLSLLNYALITNNQWVEWWGYGSLVFGVFGLG